MKIFRRCFVLCMHMHAYVLAIYTYLRVTGWGGETERRGRDFSVSGAIHIGLTEKLDSWASAS